jgi:antitoxin HicB
MPPQQADGLPDFIDRFLGVGAHLILVVRRAGYRPQRVRCTVAARNPLGRLPFRRPAMNAIKRIEMTLQYRVILIPDDNDTFLVSCPRLPIVATYGATRGEALHHAVDAIEAALASMIDDGNDIPRPSAGGRGTPVRLPLMTSLKVQLYWALRDAGITRAELARRLSWNRESVDRLFRLDHRSRLEQLEAAFAALGRHVDLRVAAA